MSGTLTVKAGLEPTGTVHWLPVSTSHSGSCKVDEFFHPETAGEPSSSGADKLVAQLRGRQLQGIKRALPPGCGGLLVAPAPPSAASAADERSWAAVAAFDRLAYWNHDTAPAASDWQARALDWLALAEQVQAPITLAEVEAEMAAAGAAAPS